MNSAERSACPPADALRSSKTFRQPRNSSSSSMSSPTSYCTEALNDRPIVMSVNSRRSLWPSLLARLSVLQVGEAACDYIQLYRGDREGLMASLDRIRNAATVIIKALDPAP